MSNTYGPIHACQICGSNNFEPVVFLGFLPPVNRMREIDSIPDEETWFPANMLCCRECHLAQLEFAVDPQILFPPDYPYTSGSTKILRDNFAELYREASSLITISADDLIVDIGSNDGTLLGNFHEAGHRVLGVEPSLTAKIAESRGIPTMMTFFGPEAADQVLETQGPAKIVTAANVFAHIHHVHEIVDSIEKLVGDDGVFISESHYLAPLVETLQYDTIYHEHLRYYSLTSLKHLLDAHGLTIFHVKQIPTHGGSIRVYATKSSEYVVDDTVSKVLKAEQAGGFDRETWIDGFRHRVQQSKLDLYDLLASIKRDGKKIYGIGAPSRASTLINYVGLDEGILDCVLELSTSKKINKYMPGTLIPVLDEQKLFDDQPEYALLLSWHISEELCNNLRKKGFRGDFIVPLPEPCILKNNDIVKAA